MATNVKMPYDLPNPGPLTEAQKALVKSTVPILEKQGPEITRRFYKAMLSAHPDLKNTFNNSKQQQGGQAEALARAVYGYAAHIDDPTPILPYVERITHKHVSLNIQPSQYKIVGHHLLSAITEVVGPSVFQGELYDAWYAAYWELARLFIGLEEKLYEGAEWVGWREFVVRERVKETEDVCSFYLVPKDGGVLPEYKPGQYISVQRYIPELGFNQSRHPSPRPVSWIQSVHSRASHALNDEIVSLLTRHPSPSQVKRAIFYSDVRGAAQGHDYDYIGRMDLNKLGDNVLRIGDESAQYYVCGPEKFMEEIGKSLKGRGVDLSRIHSEMFSAAANPISGN